MNSRILAAIALVFGAIGCSVQETEVPSLEGPVQLVFKAEPFYDGDSAYDTKTSVIPNADYTNYSFIWSAKDTVGIYPNTGGQVYFEMSNGAGASSAQFDGGGWACKSSAVYRSYFPFIGDIYLDQTKIPVSFIGQKQIGNDNSDHFKQYDFMYTPATSSNGNEIGFSYKHLICGILVWAELPAGHYTGVTLTVDEPIFLTKGEYDLTSANPAIVGKKFSNSLHVDLDITLANTDILKAYVLNAPINLTGKTVTIAITNETGFTYHYTYTPSKPFIAANIYRMRAASSLVDYANTNIAFADANIKAKLVAAFDTNGDDDISYGEAAAVTTIEGIFGDTKNFTSFNEFQFFTGIKTIPSNAFNGWTIKSIILPESITTIKNSAFHECTELEHIIIPDSVKTLESNFTGCSALETVVIGSNIKTIPIASFVACYALRSIVFRGNTTTLEQQAFQRCTSLVDLCLPDSIVDIGYKAFDGCTSLKTIVMGANVKTIGADVFSSASSVELTVKAIEPPSIGLYTFRNSSFSAIYVPAESVGEYKAAPYWSNYADRIQAIWIPEAVDLGLSVRWANVNLGATVPEEKGDLFAWGETVPKGSYTEDNYKYYQSSDEEEGGFTVHYSGYTKYVPISAASNYGYKGFYDDKTVLEEADDAATQQWGALWRMPTSTEMNELKNNCTWVWATLNGKDGFKVTGPNGNYIFLPETFNNFTTSCYWTSEYKNNLCFNPEHIVFDSSGFFSAGGKFRHLGYSIRPVKR